MLNINRAKVEDAADSIGDATAIASPECTQTFVC